MNAPGQTASTRPARSVDLLYAIEIVQADPEWPTKLGLFLLVWLVPILGWLVVMGWLSYGARRAIARLSPVLLPPTADLTTMLDYAEQGLKAIVVSLVWSLPAAVLSVSAIGCLYFGLVASVISAASGADGTDGASLAMIPLFFCGAIVVLAALAVINAVLSLPAAAAALRSELSGMFAPGFDVSAVMAMVRLVMRDWLLNLVLLALASLMMVTLANALPFVGIFVSTFLVTLMRVFAVVSVYEKYLAAGGQPVALGPMEPRASAR
ncbi:MAG: DUF4013 domain-containing protein [Deltaproteobacteria bacterium]|nr:DUF4013 domain-containing protein [Deltaproteobacteria bacterium]